MEINELENIANKEKLNIVNWKMKPKARILDKFIFMDYSKIDSYTEEKCLLAEEIRTLLLRCLLYSIFFSN